ncbi:50S ribosomal protein L4 [bacterium]|nr:50S ribosomal protein L4 [bacterium]
MESIDVKELKLNKEVWKVPYNADLIAQVIYIYRANARKGSANIKSRGDVSGGGKKPWKQKGTGRARAGSTRSPLWVHGGAAFATVGERVFDRRLNKKMARKAVCIMLSDRLKDEKLAFATFGSDAKAERKAVLDKYNKSLLVVTGNEEAEKMLRNIEFINIITPEKVNAKHLLENRNIIVDKESINILETRLTNGK